VRLVADPLTEGKKTESSQKARFMNAEVPPVFAGTAKPKKPFAVANTEF
jgi:hypothetical protein